MLEMARRGILFALATLFLAAPLEASSLQGTEVERVLGKIAAAQERILTLEASFSQEKTSGLLAEPQISSGSFIFSRPGKALWNYHKPTRLDMLITDGWMTTYYPELHRAERIEIRQYEERIFRYLGATAGAMSDLAKYFDFRLVDTRSSPHYTLELTPKTPRIARRVQRIKVEIDRESYLTTAIEYVEGDGDFTSYEFTDLKVNGSLPDSRFQLSMPSSVRVETVTASGAP